MICELLGLPEDYNLTAVLNVGVLGEEGYPREKTQARHQLESCSLIALSKWTAGNFYGKTF